ncbi:hypothetical protein E1301_Tti004791 [Triplophysa tibetana]|uniref:Uncharacterized protein n=1 Tax=Triplophysa tibetana TaxID=1572043 RepID=A0A5A9NR40_9TELE|nr:hypothetical protein E1301_Tti004791 [Triplophysa tibetana]
MNTDLPDIITLPLLGSLHPPAAGKGSDAICLLRDSCDRGHDLSPHVLPTDPWLSQHTADANDTQTRRAIGKMHHLMNTPPATWREENVPSPSELCLQWREALVPVGLRCACVTMFGRTAARQSRFGEGPGSVASSCFPKRLPEGHGITRVFDVFTNNAATRLIVAL